MNMYHRLLYLLCLPAHNSAYAIATLAMPRALLSLSLCLFLSFLPPFVVCYNTSSQNVSSSAPPRQRFDLSPSSSSSTLFLTIFSTHTPKHYTPCWNAAAVCATAAVISTVLMYSSVPALVLPHMHTNGRPQRWSNPLSVISPNNNRRTTTIQYHQRGVHRCSWAIAFSERETESSVKTIA